MTGTFIEKMNRYYGSKEGAFTEMTSMEMSKLTFNVKAVIRDLLIKYLGIDSIPKAWVNETQEMVFNVCPQCAFTKEKTVSLQCKISKIDKNEMTIYFTKEMLKKYGETDYWYIYFKSDSMTPYIGFADRETWKQAFPELFKKTASELARDEMNDTMRDKASVDYRNLNYVKTEINKIDFYTFSMRIKDLIKISYVSVRGKDNEAGAVQRVLNRKRIGSIKQYVLEGNMFANSFILNWNDQKMIPSIKSETFIHIPIINNAAQLIDGQHRLEGIKEAAKEDGTILEKMVLVSMAIRLDTKEAANIFININSEQKPVPKSLIYDLYGETGEFKNFAITRAGDIARDLNENPESPFYNLIKYPGNPRGKGKIDLSTVVSALKGYVDISGKFVENNIRDLDLQTKIIINFYSTIKYFWDKEQLWDNASQNVFFKASGFIAMTEFFFDYIFDKCVEKKNFKPEYMISLFDFSDVSLIKNDDIKNSDGKSARKLITDDLREGLRRETPQEDEYDV